MNSISWFIYIAQICGSLGILFCVLGIGLMMLVMARFVFPFVRNSVECESPGDRGYVPPRPISRGYMTLAVVFLVIGNVMPQSSTMYAIAASQVGEQIAKSETVQEAAGDATKALRQWIKRQIEPETKN